MYDSGVKAYGRGMYDSGESGSRRRRRGERDVVARRANSNLTGPVVGRVRTAGQGWIFIVFEACAGKVDS